MNILRIVLVVVVSLNLLTACGKTARDFQYTPTAVLCERLLNTPTYNIHREGRERALYERGEDCADYTHLKSRATTVSPQRDNEPSIPRYEPPPQQPIDNPAYCSGGRVMTSYGCRYR